MDNVNLATILSLLHLPFRGGLSRDYGGRGGAIVTQKSEGEQPMRSLADNLRSEHCETLRLKLATVNKYIEAWEVTSQRLWTSVSNIAATCEVAEVVARERGIAELTSIFANAKVSISDTASPKSLILEDLARAVAELGEELKDHTEGLLDSTLGLLLKPFTSEPIQLEGKQQGERLLQLASAQAEVITVLLKPAILLRQKLMDELKCRAKPDKKPTRHKEAARARDKRAVELHRQNPDASVRRLTEMLEADPHISGLGAVITRNTTRRAIESEKARVKKQNHGKKTR